MEKTQFSFNCELSIMKKRVFWIDTVHHLFAQRLSKSIQLLKNFRRSIFSFLGSFDKLRIDVHDITSNCNDIIRYLK